MTGFEELYDATARDLLAFLLRRTATPEDAADCLAETFLIAWQKRQRVPSRVEDARPWLFGVARNVLRRGIERSSRSDAAVAALAAELRRLPTYASGALALPVPPIRAALDELSPLDREIITMLTWDQLPPREVAIALGLSANVVRVRAHRARAKLREVLSTDVADEASAVLSDKASDGRR